LNSLQTQGINIKYATESLKNDKEIALKILNGDTKNIQYLGKEIRNNKEMGLKAVSM
jgi:hypothetical protein